MRNDIWILGLVIAIAGPLRAQDTLSDTKFLRDYAETRGFMLGRPTKAKPTPDGKAVLFLRAQARVPKLRLYEFDVDSGKTRELLTPELVLKGASEKLTPEEKARRERQRVSVGGFTDFQLSDDASLILVSLSGKLYVVKRTPAPAAPDVRELATGAGTIVDPKFAPDGKSVSYVLDHDVYVYDLATNKERRVTTGGTEKMPHGLAEFVAQEEMSRFTGYWWSPDSQKIVYQENDANGVEVWYVADPVHPDQPALPSYYPRPGKANVKVRLGITPVAHALPAAQGSPTSTTWIDWDSKKYPYLTRVHWGKTGPLTIQVQTRDQQELVLLKVDPASGKTAPLVTETDKAWVNLELHVPRWLDDGKRFLWISERDGGPQLELRGADGKLLSVLVPPAFGFQELIDAGASDVVYRASADPTQSQLFRASLDNGKSVPLTQEPGMHNAVFARNHAVWVHSFTGLETMPRMTVQRADGTVLGTLESVAEEPPFKPRAELIKLTDGPGSYATIVRPRQPLTQPSPPRGEGKKEKRYPVIVDVYGGPGHNHVFRAMRNELLPQWLADQGFIVVSIDGRGTPGRGRDWERSLYKKFGSVPLDDQVAGLKELGRRFPEMDLERTGIVGWSFGGYMSGLAVLRRPDVFKAGVAGAPVVDWLDYDTHYTERYLGVPAKDDPAYKEASLLTYADQLSRPLLLLHGTADDNVYFRHSLKLVNALFRAGKDVDILPLSGLTHMVPDPVVTERLWSRVALYFRKHLGKPTG